MEIKQSDRIRSVFVDVTRVPEGGGKNYNIFVFKKNFNQMVNMFADISNKVSKRSEFKKVADKLSTEKDWNFGKPDNIPNYKPDRNKYFFGLTVEEIAILRDMIYAYKSKLNGGTFMVGDSVVQRNGAVQTILAGVVSKLKHRKNNSGAVNHEDVLSEKLSQANMQRVAKEQVKFKKLVDKSFARYDRQTSEQSKKILDSLNSLLKAKDKIRYNEIDCKVSEGESKATDTIEIMRSKRERFERVTVEDGYNEEDRKQILEAFFNWAENVGTRMKYGAKAFERVHQYLERGYKIISVLGTGGMATVVKFLDKKGKEKALKFFYEEHTGYEDEIAAIRSMKEKLGIKGDNPNKKSAMKKYFNAPKIGKDGELRMKLARKVLDGDKFIKRGGKLTSLKMSFFKKMARSVLKGLKKLHEVGKLHGDIKPDNIHIMKDGTCKIADVGSVSDAIWGVVNTVMYTHPDWMEKPRSITPEQKQKNDVYGLGCSLLDILCGKRVGKYVGFSVASVLSEVMPQFTDESMNNESVLQLLKFIKKLCADKLDDVPTAEEALKDSFLH